MTLEFKHYPNKKILKNVDDLLKMSDEELKELDTVWTEIKKENSSIFDMNGELFEEKINEINAYLTKENIQTRNINNSRKAWFRNNIYLELQKNYRKLAPEYPIYECWDKKYTLNSGIQVQLTNYLYSLVEIKKYLKNQIESKLKFMPSNTKVSLYQNYANQHNIELPFISSAVEIIKTVEKVAKERYLKENYPDGTTIDLEGNCSECNEYVVGDSRCSCGNIRVHLEIDGNALTGYFVNPVRH